MAVPINRNLVQQLIEEQYGSVDQLAVEWQVRHQANPKATARPRDRSTIYKWLDSGLPANKDVLFGFCALLDVDPIGIIESSREFIEQNFAKERRAWQMSDKRDTLMAPFRIMYLPGWRWPPSSLAERYYGREWCVREHLYEPGDVRNEYAALGLTPDTPLKANHPRVYHFAYKQKNAIDRLWRPYGVVIVVGDRVRLISESGDWQEISDESCSHSIDVETFFGPRACRFRIASLHPFELMITVPTTAEIAVRFY